MAAIGLAGIVFILAAAASDDGGGSMETNVELVELQRRATGSPPPAE
jgi:hypothetical protein